MTKLELLKEKFDLASEDFYHAGEQNREAYLNLQKCERNFRDAGCDYYIELEKENNKKARIK